MDEHARRLRATLKELEAELHTVGTVDPDTRAMLLATVDEIQSALHANTSAASSPPHTLGAQLNRAAVEFDASHPTLASLVRKVVDALAQLGI